MKRSFLLFIILALFGCQTSTVPASNSDDATTSDTTAGDKTTTPDLHYFVYLESDKTSGTVNTTFTFTANTDDIMDSWYIDSVSTGTKEYTYSGKLSAGKHTISVKTKNGATDSVAVSVSELTVVYAIKATRGAETSDVRFDGTTITGAVSVTSSETETVKTIEIAIYVDTDSETALNSCGMDVKNLTADNLKKLIPLINPNVEPEYTKTVYCLTSTVASTHPVLSLSQKSLICNGIEYKFRKYAIYNSGVKTVNITIPIDFDTSFLFMNNNMQTFFGIDLMSMTFQEFIKAVDIINRYPAESLKTLQGVYPK